MKNVILTHNELQLNLFFAFTYGLMKVKPATNCYIIWENSERDYEWRVMHAPPITGPSNDDSWKLGKPIFYFQINKGEYQMNDVRLGVTTSYLREQSEKFLAEFKAYAEKNTALGIEVLI